MSRLCIAQPAACLLLAGCAYVGDPLPPALNIPERVTDLRLFQQGTKVRIGFTIPDLTTDGLGLKLGEVQLCASDQAPSPDGWDEWARACEQIPVNAPGPGAVSVSHPAGEWSGKQIHIAVRLSSRKGRWSDWSDPATLAVIPTLEPPGPIQLSVVKEGVRLRWPAPPADEGYSFRVWRIGPDESQPSAAADVQDAEWLDRAVEFGKTYRYAVQAIRKSGAVLAESELPAFQESVPVDTFPPAVPAGLTAIFGLGTVELAWDRSHDPDLAGYRLYRSVAGAELRLLDGLITAPSYTDRDVAPGQVLRYSVAAVDANGNESARSEAVEIAVR